MKRIIFISLLICICTYTLGQNYESMFGDSSSNWHQAQGVIDHVRNITIELYGDTTVNSRMYKRLLVDDTSIIDSSLFVREDTIEGKTWVLDSDNAIEYLIMDLSLEKGDTFLMTKVFSYQDSLAIVDSVYEVNNRKFIELDYEIRVDLAINKLTFIEGIGPNAGLLYQVYSLDENSVENHLLLCYYRDSELIFRDTVNSSDDCSFMAKVNLKPDIKPIDLQCYPNPSKEELYIVTQPNTVGNIKLIDTAGRIVHSALLDYNGNTIISVNQLLSGTYILLIVAENMIIGNSTIKIVH